MYQEVMRGDDSEMKALYLGENLGRYSYDSLTKLEKAAYGGDYEKLVGELERYLMGESEIGVDFSGGENKRVGGKIYLSSSLLEGGNFSGNGGPVEWDLNKAAKLTSLLSHEWKHDGIVGDDYAGEYAEDIAAHTFDTVVWEGLKGKFEVEDNEMDRKLIAYQMLDRQLYEEYLESEYELGAGAYNNRGDYKGFQGYVAKVFSIYGDKSVADAMRMMRGEYIEEIGHGEYGIGYFNEDMRIYFDRGMEVDEEDFEQLKSLLNHQIVELIQDQVS